MNTKKNDELKNPKHTNKVNPRLMENGYISIKQCLHGLFMYNLNDLFIGRSLDLYGEWCNEEIILLNQLLRKGDVVLDVGANIGTHTVFFAKAVSQEGMVFAFEPQRVTFQFLCTNIALNELLNVKPMQVGVGKKPDSTFIPILNPSVQQNFGVFNIQGHDKMAKVDKVDIITLDSLELNRCNLIKIDVEGMECEVLKGAEATIRKLRPFIFVENNSQEGSPELVETLFKFDYMCYWQIANYFNPKNFFMNPENIWQNFVPEANMICLPKETSINPTGFEKVIDASDTWVLALKRLGVIK